MNRRKWAAYLATTCTAVISAGLFAEPATAASTGVAKVSGSTVIFTAKSGAASKVVVTGSDKSVVIDDRVKVKPGRGCKTVRGDKTRVRCTAKKKITLVEAALGSGNDRFVNQSKFRVSVTGGSGDDQLTGGVASDVLRGGTGSDILVGGAGNDWLYGDAGNDTLKGDAGNDRYFGGTGNDWLTTGAGGDTLSGGPGYDSAGWLHLRASDQLHIDLTYTATAGSATVHSQPGGQTAFAVLSELEAYHGGDGEDHFKGDSRPNTFYGGRGDDVINSGDGGDRVYGGEGADFITTGSGDDVINGNGGADRILAGAGDDVLYGELGEDTLNGEGGNDRLWSEPAGAFSGSEAVFGGDQDDVCYVPPTGTHRVVACETMATTPPF